MSLRRIIPTVFRIALWVPTVGTLFLANAGPVHPGLAAESLNPEQTQPETTPAASFGQICLPLATFGGFHPPVELLSSWISGPEGDLRSVFLPNEEVKYVVRIANNTNALKWATVTWHQSGPCGEAVVAEQTLKFAPGETEVAFPAIMPDCQGVHTNFIEVTHKDDVFPGALQHVVTTPFQGLDKCSLPTINQMQTWWNESPYWTMNIYIGGISLACKDPKLGTDWLAAVASQGWTFTLTWVGPQAPCTNFNYKMSANAATAKSQGRAEADAAAAKVLDLGFSGGEIIYYDLEGYSGGATTSCKAAVASFMQGWVERLHELGFKAGAYGGACSSFVAEWAMNPSPPDVVWMAHWYKSAYTPYAHVWNTPCVGNELWPNHQRLKQYAGDHVETWGGISFTIDANVLDGEVTTFTTTTEARVSAAGEPGGVKNQVEPEGIRDMQLLTPDLGWVLRGGQLLWTADGGLSWQDISPGGGIVLGVHFLDADHGWLVRPSVSEDEVVTLTVQHTADSGRSWESVDLPLLPGEIPYVASADPYFVDPLTGWVALRLQSGNNFSLGRLFSTRDGGRSWQELPLPLGEPVVFLNQDRGWVAGGPLGDRLYYTGDGGHTWNEQVLQLPVTGTGESVFTTPPEFVDDLNGFLPVTLAGEDSSRLAVYTTANSGSTWTLSRIINLGPFERPSGPLPFTLDSGGQWWAALPEAQRLFRETNSRAVQTLTPTGIPGTIVALESASSETAWALLQEAACQGDKRSAGEPFQCELRTSLAVTRDGGETWSVLALPD